MQLMAPGGSSAAPGRLLRWIPPRVLTLFGWQTTSGVLTRVRAGIALVVLPLAALGVVLTATDVTAPVHRNLPAAAAVAALWWLWWQCARERPSSKLTTGIEAGLVFTALLFEGSGVWAFSTVSVALFLRAAFGGEAEFLVRGVLWSVAAFASAVFRADWGWAPWWLRVVDTLWFFPSYLLAGGLIRVVVSVLKRHEAALARERVLLGAGVALVSSTSKEDIYQVALDAIVDLVDRPGVEAEIDEKTVEGSVRVGSRRGSGPAAESAAAAYEMHLEVRRELLTVITVKSAEPLPRDSMEALQHLESNLALAMRNASLTEELRRQAHYDALTGLPNRALLYERLEEALRPDQRQSVALLLIDLDSFKQVNDTLGHEGGDVLLNHVGQALRSCTRQSDTPARLGGDEFAVLLVGVDGSEAALATADRIVDRLSTLITVRGVEVMPRGSVGVALWDGTSGPDELLRAADTAMYSAKSAGKGRSHLFGRSIPPQAAA